MNAPPKWFKVVAVVALLWNLLGCFAFASDLKLSPEDVAKLSVAEQALYAARPIWAVAATAASLWLGLALRQEMQREPQVVHETKVVTVQVPAPAAYVALLQPPKSEARWKVQIDPQRRVIKLAASGRYASDDAHSLELWLLDAAGPKPLGLLPKDGERVKLDEDRIRHWLGNGAVPTDRVARFLDQAGIAKRESRNNPEKAKPGKKAQERIAVIEKARADAAAAAAEPAGAEENAG